MPPRRVVPTLQNIAANAVMAGCKPEYFPVVVSTVRALLNRTNLHGTLATTHPCAPGVISTVQFVRSRDQLRQQLFWSGTPVKCDDRARGAIDVIEYWRCEAGGDGPLDRGSPAKYAFCFGENEEESPWEPYHVRRGFAADDSVVTVLPCEPHTT